MNWYYLDDSGQVAGPVTEDELNELKEAGVVTEDAQVCREGSEEWMSLGIALSEAQPSSSGATSFNFSCPHCEQHIAASTEQLGLRTQCPKCEGSIQVPTFGQEKVAKSGQKKSGKRAVTYWVAGALAILVVVSVAVVAARGPRDNHDPVGNEARKSIDDKATEEKSIAAIEELGGSAHDDGAIFFENIPVTDAALLHLEGLPHSTKVCISRTEITDAGLVHFKGLTGLKELDLTDNKITDAGLAHLQGLTELRELDLDGTELTDAGLVHLKGMIKLERLELSETKITDAGLLHLKGLTDLKELFLDGTGVTDAGLVRLKEMTKLEKLTLSDTKVTDAGLVHLQVLTELQKLFLYNTGVTDAGVTSAGLRRLEVFLPSALEQQRAKMKPWKDAPYVNNSGDDKETTAEGWLRTDLTKNEIAFEEFEFGMSRKELEEHFSKVTSQELQTEGYQQDTRPEGVEVLSAGKRTFTLLNDRLVQYERSFSVSAGTEDETRRLAEEKMREVIDYLDSAGEDSVGPAMRTDRDGHISTRFAEVGLSNCLGIITESVGSDARNNRFGLITLTLFHKDYISQEMVPKIDWYVDAICRAIEKGDFDEDLWHEESDDTHTLRPTAGLDLEYGPGGYSPAAASLIARGTMLCLGRRLKPIDDKSSGTTSSIPYMIRMSWKYGKNIKIEIDGMKVSYSKLGF